jgi:hypothetical protein
MPIVTLGDKTFNCDDKQYVAICQLMSAHKGFAQVVGYNPSTGWKTIPTHNINCLVGFRTSSLYVRQIEALRTLTLKDLDLSNWVPNKGANACATPEEQFELCIEKLIESKTKTLDGVRDDAHRIAHDRNYSTICHSIKVNFVTQMIHGLQIPVLAENGLPTVASILVPYLERHVKVVVEGERKTVNSGSKVLMDNAIDDALPLALHFKMVSLKPDNFQSMRCGGEEIFAEDICEEDRKVALAAFA